VFGDVEAERPRLNRVLSARLKDQPDRRAREPEQDEPAEGHEPERDPVIDAVAGADHVGHGEPDLAACQVGEHHDEVLQQQHRDKRDEPEIRPAHA
jgi:hypothetical protein